MRCFVAIFAPLSLLPCAVLLGGCGGGSNAATEANFTKAINDHLAAHNPSCKVFIEEGNTCGWIKRQHFGDMLEAKGYVTFNCGYHVTEKGKPFFTESYPYASHRVSGCFGSTPVVTSIVRFTQPSPVMGQIISKVRYRYWYRPFTKWAVDLKFEEILRRTQHEDFEDTIDLIQTNTGWTDHL